MGHPLVRLAERIDWEFLDGRFGSVCQPGPGQPGLPTRLVAGLFILKLPQAALRPLLADAVAAALGRGAARGAHPGEPIGGAQDRRDRDQGSRAGRCRHDGAAEGDRASDRCAADAPGDRQTRRSRQAQRCPLTSELSAAGQARRDHGWPRHPRPSIQARPAPAQIPAHPSRPRHSRHPPTAVRFMLRPIGECVGWGRGVAGRGVREAHEETVDA